VSMFDIDITKLDKYALYKLFLVFVGTALCCNIGNSYSGIVVII
jgi:hypothetical protein